MIRRRWGSFSVRLKRWAWQFICSNLISPRLSESLQVSCYSWITAPSESQPLLPSSLDMLQGPSTFRFCLSPPVI
ncbi:hypothetical protein B0J12DRAFT_638068 [Macrophomina phaseolina]|uniref:Secreted protein n=1 Tax=Macrophomina phaseolina TaxID=35725 RepID=A0ABQ8GWU2_9PEZI|nr:hypothetical protein B0J12DRAFT_638068 [Macrophomina phaseolina]